MGEDGGFTAESFAKTGLNLVGGHQPQSHLGIYETFGAACPEQPRSEGYSTRAPLVSGNPLHVSRSQAQPSDRWEDASLGESQRRRSSNSPTAASRTHSYGDDR